MRARFRTRSIFRSLPSDEQYGYLNQNHAALYYTDYLWKDTEKVTLHGNHPTLPSTLFVEMPILLFSLSSVDDAAC